MYNNCILTNVPSYRIIDEVQREKVCEGEGEEEEEKVEEEEEVEVEKIFFCLIQ